jgi:hypothetical protein
MAAIATASRILCGAASRRRRRANLALAPLGEQSHGILSFRDEKRMNSEHARGYNPLI